MLSFSELGLKPEIVRGLESFGFPAPTDIQVRSADALLQGKDAYIASATGSGKTFAYLAPILSSLDRTSNMLGAIILAPTHDLAAQLFRETEKLIHACGLDFRCAQALGSINLQRQKEQLRHKPQLLIGSAGRIRDLVEQRYIDISACRFMVMDEGDRLLEKEVIDISTDLLNRLPASCSRILVSATIADRIIQKTAAWFREPEHCLLDSAQALRESIEHWCFHAPSRKKTDFLRKFEVAVQPSRCLVFVSSNAQLHTVAGKLEYFGIEHAILRTNQSGAERKSAVERFSEGEVRWLLSTDLGARGLDIPLISHVLSFDLPEEPSVYVHRAGRTGRAGRRGVSVVLADMVELKRASKIAVRYEFPFICKILDSGHVHDIEPENFFALAEEAESHKEQPKDNVARQAQRHTPGQGRWTNQPGSVKRGSGYSSNALSDMPVERSKSNGKWSRQPPAGQSPKAANPARSERQRPPRNQSAADSDQRNSEARRDNKASKLETGASKAGRNTATPAAGRSAQNRGSAAHKHGKSIQSDGTSASKNLPRSGRRKSKSSGKNTQPELGLTDS